MKRKIAVFLLCLLLCGCTAAPRGLGDVYKRQTQHRLKHEHRKHRQKVRQNE